jgi:hypothetical protein
MSRTGDRVPATIRWNLCSKFGSCGNFYICDEAYFVAFKLETERQGRHPRLLAFCTAAISEHGHFYGFYMLLVVVMQEHDMWETISYARVN